MKPSDVALPGAVTLDGVRSVLRDAGAVFAFLHGSRAEGTERAESDLDVAAWFGRPTDGWRLPVPERVDLVVLDTAGFELAGRVAQRGLLLLDDDPPTRVRWQADLTKRYLDEDFRRRELVRTVLGRG